MDLAVSPMGSMPYYHFYRGHVPVVWADVAEQEKWDEGDPDDRDGQHYQRPALRRTWK